MKDKKIPVYDAILQEGGFVGLGIVEDPAIEVDFQCFSATDQAQGLSLFSIESEEQRIVTGPLIRVDHNILRIDRDKNPYYIRFSKETAREMLQQFLTMGFQNNVDLSHTAYFPEGIEPLEFYIKDSKRGIAPKGYDDVADGSVFATYHISNDSVWKACKDGTFKGFSVEVYLDKEPAKDFSKLPVIDLILDIITNY